MREAVTRTRENFSSRIDDIVALTREVDEAALEELETALLTSDIGVQTTTEVSMRCANARGSRPSRAAQNCATC